MGYYSIYKIFKDIFTTIFGRKFIKFLFIFIISLIIILFIYKNNVNAVSVEYNNTTYDLPDPPSFDTAIGIESRLNTYPDGYKYIIIGYSTYSQKFILTYVNSSTLLKYTPTNSNNGAIRSSSVMYLIQYSLIDNNWVYTSNSYRSDIAISISTPLFTTTDILNADGTIYKPAQSLIKYPEIANSLSDLETLDFDVISINGWDWSNKDFDVLFYDRNNVDTSTTDGLYPKRVITLNKNTSYYQPTISADPDKNAIFWIPIEETGLNFYIGGNYEIRLAERVPIQGGGGFRNGDEYSYNYLGQSVTFTISSNTTQDRINSINKQIEETTQKKYHDETISSINNINNNINNINDNLTNTTPDTNIDSYISNSFNYNKSTENLSNMHNGFFSRLMALFSSMQDYNLNEDTVINIPIPHSNKYITLHSNIISSHIAEPLKSIITAFWMYVFYFYAYKFFNYILIEIEEGRILDENSMNNAPGALHASVF